MKFQFEEDYSFEARKKLAEDQAKGPDNLMPVIFQRLQTGDYKGTTYHQMMSPSCTLGVLLTGFRLRANIRQEEAVFLMIDNMMVMPL